MRNHMSGSKWISRYYIRWSWGGWLSLNLPTILEELLVSFKVLSEQSLMEEKTFQVGLVVEARWKGRCNLVTLSHGVLFAGDGVELLFQFKLPSFIAWSNGII